MNSPVASFNANSDASSGVAGAPATADAAQGYPSKVMAPTESLARPRVPAWKTAVRAVWAQQARVLAFASITCPLLVWLLSRQDAHWSQLPVSLERQALAGNCSWWGEFHRAPLISLAVVGLFGWAFRWARWIEAAWAGLLGGAGAGLVAMVAKVIFGRPRPAVHLLDGFYWFKLGSSWASFPSGHAAHCFGMAVGASLVLPRLWPVSLAGAFLVAWSRFALHRHYPSDLLAGATVGIVMGMLFGLAARRRLAAAAELTEWTNRS